MSWWETAFSLPGQVSLYVNEFSWWVWPNQGWKKAADLTQIAKDAAPQDVDSEFGQAAALNGQGVAVVFQETNPRKVFTFTDNQGSWSLLTILEFTSITVIQVDFGGNLFTALTPVVSAPNEILTFQLEGGSWVSRPTLQVGVATREQAQDGQTLLVDTETAISFYAWDGAMKSWTPQQEITGPGGNVQELHVSGEFAIVLWSQDAANPTRKLLSIYQRGSSNMWAQTFSEDFDTSIVPNRKAETSVSISASGKAAFFYRRKTDQKGVIKIYQELTGRWSATQEFTRDGPIDDEGGQVAISATAAVLASYTFPPPPPVPPRPSAIPFGVVYSSNPEPIPAWCYTLNWCKNMLKYKAIAR